MTTAPDFSVGGLISEARLAEDLCQWPRRAHEATIALPRVGVPDFSITKLTVVDGLANERGNRLLASFNLNLPIMSVRGCILIEKATGIVAAYGPSGKAAGGHKVGADLMDPVLARAVTRRAALIYGAFTGRELSDD